MNDNAQTSNEFSGSNLPTTTAEVNSTRLIDLFDLEQFKRKCRGPPPSAEEIVTQMDSTHLVVHLILIIMAFTTLGIFVEEIFYLRSKLQRNYRRRRMSILQAGIPPTFALTAVVGTFFPRGNLMIDFVCSVYFGFAMHALLNLMVNYYGGITAMLQRLEGHKVQLSTPPVCCCCRCLPQVSMTRKTFKFLYCLTFQAAAGRPVILFFRGVFVLDPTFSVNEMIFSFILVVSMSTGMWALSILRGVSGKVLKHFNITAKFFCFQAVLLISNIQPFILKLAKLPCVLPYTIRGRIITVNYQIIIVEFFLISLLMRCLYRTKRDAEDLEDIEKRNRRCDADHFDRLLNIPERLDRNTLDQVQQRPCITAMSEEPVFQELLDAIERTSSGKAPGRCGIPAEIWKHGGITLQQKLHELVLLIWKNEQVPQDWKDASIVPLFKKGSRVDCGNYRGISLLSIVGKILARILLNRLNSLLTTQVLPETQCGFRSGRSTMDMIFSLRQVQEKCLEQNMPLYAVFIDFSKAFDTVSREGLWQILRKFGCPEKFINLIASLHDGMQAHVLYENAQSRDFAVSTGVKQGCVLAPTLFSLYLAAMLEMAFRSTYEGIYIQTRHNADLLNVSHFKAKTKTERILVQEMLFADDSAIVALTAEDIQALVDRFAGAARSFSLTIKKTECLYQPSKLVVPPPSPSDIKINNENLVQCKNFVYLGSTISDSAKLDKELMYRIGKASSSFGRLQERLWNNHHVSVKPKCMVYRAVVLSSLLYGAESWTSYRFQAKKLHACMMRHLRQIMNVSWRDRITNIEILKRAGLPSMADMLITKCLRWIGHVHRMGYERLPRQLLYSQLKLGQRNLGRPRLRFKDVAKRNMKWKDINTHDWQSKAMDRSAWRTVIQPKS